MYSQSIHEKVTMKEEIAGCHLVYFKATEAEDIMDHPALWGATESFHGKNNTLGFEFCVNKEAD